MDDIGLYVCAKIAPNGSRRCARSISDTGKVPDDTDRVLSCDAQGNNRSPFHKFDHLAIKRLVCQMRVMCGQQIITEPEYFHRGDLQAFSLKPRNDIADQPAAHTVRLDKHECGFAHDALSIPLTNS